MDKSQLKEFNIFVEWCKRAIEKGSGCTGLSCQDCPFITGSEYCNKINLENDLSPAREYLEWTG